MLSGLKNFAMTFLIAALIFGLLAYFIVGFVLDALTDTISDPISTDTYETVLPSTTTAPTSETTVPVTDNINGETFNFLLIGTDYQPEILDHYDYEENFEGDGFPDIRNRKITTDTLMIVRVDKENRKFVFCSLPSNTQVTVKGITTCLGDVYADYGVETLCGQVSGLTGLEMNYYAVLDVQNLAEAIDILGGVDYYVTEDMQYEDPEQNLVIDLKKGMTKLDGEKAAQMLRYVGYINGNSGRMATAVSFVQKMLSKITKVADILTDNEKLDAIRAIVTTNFSPDDLVNNADLIFAFPKFESVTVNYPGSSKQIDGVMYFVPSLKNALKMFADYK